MKFTLAACFASTAAAFAPALHGGTATSVCSSSIAHTLCPSAASTTALQAERMPAMPFLPAAENLKGYIGDDIGFDPFRLSDFFPMDYLRESELKHGRIAMMAVVGFIATDVGLILHPLGGGLSAVSAHDVLAEKGVMGNLAWPLGLLEIVSYLAVSEMLQGSGRAPGDYQFGVKYLEGKSDEAVKKLKYNEIMNGRLAMLAFSGMVTQSVLFEKGFPYF